MINLIPCNFGPLVYGPFFSEPLLFLASHPQFSPCFSPLFIIDILHFYSLSFTPKNMDKDLSSYQRSMMENTNILCNRQITRTRLIDSIIYEMKTEAYFSRISRTYRILQIFQKNSPSLI